MDFPGSRSMVCGPTAFLALRPRSRLSGFCPSLSRLSARPIQPDGFRRLPEVSPPPGSGSCCWHWGHWIKWRSWRSRTDGSQPQSPGEKPCPLDSPLSLHSWRLCFAGELLSTWEFVLSPFLPSRGKPHLSMGVSLSRGSFFTPVIRFAMFSWNEAFFLFLPSLLFLVYRIPQGLQFVNRVFLFFTSYF